MFECEACRTDKCEQTVSKRRVLVDDEFNEDELGDNEDELDDNEDELDDADEQVDSHIDVIYEPMITEIK